MKEGKGVKKRMEEQHTDFPTPACPVTTRTLFL
jgi:hypothetical protein